LAKKASVSAAVAMAAS